MKGAMWEADFMRMKVKYFQSDKSVNGHRVKCCIPKGRCQGDKSTSQGHGVELRVELWNKAPSRNGKSGNVIMWQKAPRERNGQLSCLLTQTLQMRKHGSIHARKLV